MLLNPLVDFRRISLRFRARIRRTGFGLATRNQGQQGEGEGERNGETKGDRIVPQRGINAKASCKSRTAARNPALSIPRALAGWLNKADFSSPRYRTGPAIGKSEITTSVAITRSRAVTISLVNLNTLSPARSTG